VVLFPPGNYPWRCLWRGSEQITMTRPCRRITLHLSQIGLTLGFTFTAVAILFLSRVDLDSGFVELVQPEFLYL
jgi:hypothetical protein